MTELLLAEADHLGTDLVFLMGERASTNGAAHYNAEGLDGTDLIRSAEQALDLVLASNIFVVGYDHEFQPAVYGLRRDDEPDVVMAGRIEQLRELVRRFIVDSAAEDPAGNDTVAGWAGWMDKAEELVGMVDRLLERRDELEDLLATAYGDLDVAQARVAILEQQNHSLRLELYRTKDQRSKRAVGSVALTMATLVSGALGSVTTHLLMPDAAAVGQQAHELVQECGDVTINVSPSPTSPDSPKTG